jgi:hypothetical protein
MRLEVLSVTMRVFLVAGLTLVVAARPAAAQYLDPGAGSVVIQVIIAGVVGLAAVLRFYWTKIVAVFSREKPTLPKQ